jgi:dihydrofolate reductase
MDYSDGLPLMTDETTDEIAMIKAIPGEDILVAGSALLVNSLLEDNLVDVIRLMVFPTVLGLGKRLFMVGEMPHNFRLVEARPVGDEGVLTLVYEPKTG